LGQSGKAHLPLPSGGGGGGDGGTGHGASALASGGSVTVGGGIPIGRVFGAFGSSAAFSTLRLRSSLSFAAFSPRSMPRIVRALRSTMFLLVNTRNSATISRAI